MEQKKDRLGFRVEFDKATKEDFDFLKERGYNMAGLIKRFIKEKAEKEREANG